MTCRRCHFLQADVSFTWILEMAESMTHIIVHLLLYDSWKNVLIMTEPEISLTILWRWATIQSHWSICEPLREMKSFNIWFWWFTTRDSYMQTSEILAVVAESCNRSSQSLQRTEYIAVTPQGKPTFTSFRWARQSLPIYFVTIYSDEQQQSMSGRRQSFSEEVTWVHSYLFFKCCVIINSFTHHCNAMNHNESICIICSFTYI